MASPISRMDDDLADFAKHFAYQAVQGVQKTAHDMAAAANGMNSPMYGLQIAARVTEEQLGAVVHASVNPVSGAIGEVFGGARAAEVALKSKMDTIAKGAGLA